MRCPGALTVLASCALGFAGACSAADLAQRLEELVAQSPGTASVGIHVVDMAGSTVYARNQEHLFLPASNLKILTSALALERLGLDYRFTTKVLRETSGDLVLLGSGDPSLSGRRYPYQKDSTPGSAMQVIEQLADAIVARGIQRVDGDIVGDDRLFPWDPHPSSWTVDDTLHEYGAPVSALSVNDNVITVSVRAGAKAGDAATLSLSPALEYLTIGNHIVTTARGGAHDIHVERVAGSRQWLVSGTIPAGHADVREVLPVDDPALFAASALYDALAASGVTIRGHAQARHRALGDQYVATTGEELAVRSSPPLSDLMQAMDKTSQNLHAELILREVGRVTRGEGTTAAGLAEMSTYLVGAGVDSGDWHLDDGSGLSRNALITPRLLTRLLVRLAGSANRETWLSLLPAGGEDGTLSRRLCCVSTGRGIRAKTGTLDRAIALSGYADSQVNGKLVFSILVNDFTAPASDVVGWVDKIAAALLE